MTAASLALLFFAIAFACATAGRRRSHPWPPREPEPGVDRYEHRQAPAYTPPRFPAGSVVAMSDGSLYVEAATIGDAAELAIRAMTMTTREVPEA